MKSSYLLCIHLHFNCNSSLVSRTTNYNLTVQIQNYCFKSAITVSVFTSMPNSNPVDLAEPELVSGVAEVSSGLLILLAYTFVRRPIACFCAVLRVIQTISRLMQLLNFAIIVTAISIAQRHTAAGMTLMFREQPLVKFLFTLWFLWTCGEIFAILMDQLWIWTWGTPVPLWWICLDGLFHFSFDRHFSCRPKYRRSVRRSLQGWSGHASLRGELMPSPQLLLEWWMGPELYQRIDIDDFLSRHECWTKFC